MRIGKTRAIGASMIALAAAGVIQACGDRGTKAPTPATAAAPPGTSTTPQTTTPPAPASSATPAESQAAERMVTREGPFIVEGAKYVVDVERYVDAPDTGVKRVVVRDTTGRIVYEEDVAAMVKGESGMLMEFSANVLEDARGRPRALQFTYSPFVSAAVEEADLRIEQSIRFLAPRDGVLKPIMPPFVYYGRLDSLPEGSQPGARRLLDGDRFTLRAWRFYFAAILSYHIDLDCATHSEACIKLAPPDSIAGLARFRAHLSWAPTVYKPQTIEMFPVPDGTTKPEQVTIGPATAVEVLGGAAHTLDSRAIPRGESEDDWLHVRVDGRTGWVRPQEGFTAIGLYFAF